MRRSTQRTAPPLLPAALLVCLTVLGGQRLQGQTWVPKGPSPGLDGGNATSAGNPIGGALEAVVAHPTNPDVLWVGSVNGGVFRTDNATSPSPQWTAQTDTRESLSIGDLALDPTDGSHNTLVAAIGTESSFIGTGGLLTGLLRTTNGGASWTPLAALAGKRVVGVAPRGSTIVAAVDGPDSNCSTLGIWRSTNTGASFFQISNGPGLPCGFTYDLASDPTDPNRLFAPVTGLNVASDGLYRTSNAGATWTQVGAGSVMDTALESPRINVHVAVGRAGGANANVFVAVCNPQQKLSGLFHSADAGATWASLDLPMSVESGTSYGIHPGAQCNLHLSLAADPVDHSVVYVGGDRQPANNENGGPGPQFPNSLGASGYFGRLYKVDADLAPGSQATPITNCQTALPGCGGSARTVGNTGPHADSRDMAFDANGDLIQTDDGGVYRHTNPLGTSGDWVSVIGDLSAVEQHSAAYDTVSNIIMSGNQDNDVTQQITSGSRAWTKVVGGDGGDIGVGVNDPVDGQSVRYASSQNLGAAQRRVFDSSNTFLGGAFLSLTPLGGAPAVTPQFVTPIEVNAAVPTRLIVGGANGVYESFDRGDSVSLIAVGATITQSGRGPLAYGVASNADALYFGVANVVYYRLGSPPAFVPFNTLPGGGIDPDTINSVVIDPDNAASAAAVDRNTVYGTNNILQVNGGWVNVTGNLFTANPGAGEINVVEWVNRPSGDLLAVGTKAGVYAATAASGFTSWSQLGAGLPNALVYDLHYDPQNDLLMANTMGRGAWTLSFEATCPWERVFSNTILNTAQTQKADGIISLGPDLTIDNGSGIAMEAGGEIVVGNGTTIGGTFTAAIDACP